MERSDEQLIDALIRKDDSAFGELISRYARALFAYLLRLTGQLQDSEDLLQETLIRIHRKAHTFKTNARFKPWAFTIATNIANDHFRKQKRRSFTLSLDDSVHPIPETAFKECAAGTACGPVTTLIKLELKEQVQLAIQVLPTRQRTALVLAYYHDLRYREVAEVMNCSVGTVKTHMSRALHKLAEILPDPGNEPFYLKPKIHNKTNTKKVSCIT